VKLDKNDPFLSHNLDRLEKRFKERYYLSIEKNKKREQGGKPSHQTILKSIEENQKRFLMVRVFRHLLLEEELKFEL
jgi:hypothetical protein